MIARVAFPIAFSGIFDYQIPSKFADSVVPGLPVKVPLRNRHLWGVVIEVGQKSRHSDLKEVVDIKKGKWVTASKTLIDLYQWIAAYYQCDLIKVFKPLIRKRFADMQAKTETVYRFSGNIPDDLTHKQKQVIDNLKNVHDSLSNDTLIETGGISAHMLSVLTRKGVLHKEKRVILRQADEMIQEGDFINVELSEEQRAAVQRIWDEASDPQKPFLLFGITGSGKTHVYIELVKRTLHIGKAVIILVPEISLTPQTIQRFRSAVGTEIAVIHSRMADGERRDSIEELVSGRKRVAIGVRSAILVPMDNIGLIIVDEEHDGSYKQSDMDPRYHARDVAVMRGKFQNALVVLGSATPSFESYHNTRTKKYNCIRLTKRYGEAVLPSVHIVDMNKEQQANNWSFLSQYLRKKMEETLQENRQIILLLNRRGFSVFLRCKICGHLYQCPHCSVNLVYHQTDMQLRCHQCGYEEQVPRMCAQCQGEHIVYKGAGIQKVEQYIRHEFPHARILRMDQDSTRRKTRHISILDMFTRRESDILLGTQMVAKGLDFPGVKLVGVLQADIGLHFPDFRASERTFQLLTQVAGRAGRKDRCGEVVIQTCSPYESGIVAAQAHDFEGFFHEESVARQALYFPPFGRLARVVVLGKTETDAQAHICKIASFIKHHGAKQLAVLGPSPAVLQRLRGMYRYSLLVKSPSPLMIQKVFSLMRSRFGKLSDGCKCIIDIDPINML